ncbi:unnamed protein product [Caretta caretta]
MDGKDLDLPEKMDIEVSYAGEELDLEALGDVIAITEDNVNVRTEQGPSHATVRQAGVATLFSPNLRPEVLGVTEAVPGRLLHLQVCMEGLVVNLVNVYAPTSGPERLQFYQRASTFLGTLDSHEFLVLGGDFNTTLEEQDRSGT